MFKCKAVHKLRSYHGFVQNRHGLSELEEGKKDKAHEKTDSSTITLALLHMHSLILLHGFNLTRLQR